MKKIFFLFGIVLSLFFLNIIDVHASTAPVYDETFNYNQGAVYANGIPIVVSESNGNTLVSWSDGSFVVPQTVSIFGGGNGGLYQTSNISMNGGTVQNIVGGGIGYTSDAASEVNITNIIINNGTITNSLAGGGYFYSKTNIANIEINGGTIFSAVGGSFATGKIGGTTYSVGTKDDAIHSECRVNTVNFAINDGIIQFGVFGGGQGYSYTGTTNLIINGGDMSSAYVTAGGSNGYTEASNVKINGSSIYLYQSVNRGTLENVDVKVISGNIDKFYIGGETEDSSVTGLLNKAQSALIGGNIQILNSGTSDGKTITIDNKNYTVITTNDIKVDTDNILDSEINLEYDFKLSKKNLTLFTNQFSKLDVNISTIPENYEKIFEDEIIYKSENPEIASINSDGIITGIKNGSTTISVTIGNKTQLVNVTVYNSKLFMFIGGIIIAIIVIAILIFVLFIPIF